MSRLPIWAAEPSRHCFTRWRTRTRTRAVISDSRRHSSYGSRVARGCDPKPPRESTPEQVYHWQSVSLSTVVDRSQTTRLSPLCRRAHCPCCSVPAPARPALCRTYWRLTRHTAIRPPRGRIDHAARRADDQSHREKLMTSDVGIPPRALTRTRGTRRCLSWTATAMLLA